MSSSLPQGWEENRLGNLLELKYGKDHKKLNDGNIPVYGSGGVMRYVSEFLYDEESILIPRKGTLSNLFYINEPFWTVDTIFWSKINIELVNGKFLFYYLKKMDLSKLNEGSAVPSLTTKVLNEVKISYPKCKNEQKRIADILSAFDDKIELNNQMNQTLEAMSTVLFKEWFIDKIDNDWTETKIKDFDVIVTDYVANGSFKSLSENVNYKEEKDYSILIRLTDFNNNFNGKFVYIDQKGHKFLKKSELFGGEIVISNVGAYSGTVFKVPSLNRPMTLGPNAIVLKSEYNNFFYLFFKSFYGKYLLDGIIGGSAQPKFNKTAFRSLNVKYPSMQHIIDFENLILPYFEKIEFNRQQNQTLKKQRDILLSKLMSGEIRV